MDFSGLEDFGDTVGVQLILRNSIIAYDRVGYAQDLSGVRRVGKAFRVTDHCGVENNFSVCTLLIPKRIALKLKAIL